MAWQAGELCTAKTGVLIYVSGRGYATGAPPVELMMSVVCWGQGPTSVLVCGVLHCGVSGVNVVTVGLFVRPHFYIGDVMMTS